MSEDNRVIVIRISRGLKVSQLFDFFSRYLPDYFVRKGNELNFHLWMFVWISQAGLKLLKSFLLLGCISMDFIANIVNIVVHCTLYSIIVRLEFFKQLTYPLGFTFFCRIDAKCRPMAWSASNMGLGTSPLLRHTNIASRGVLIGKKELTWSNLYK